MKGFIRAAPNHLVLLGKTPASAGALLGSESEMREAQALLAQTVSLHANPPMAPAGGEARRADADEASEAPPDSTDHSARRPRIPKAATEDVLAALSRHPRRKAADDDGITAEMLAAVRLAPRAVEFIRAMTTDALKRARAPMTWRQATTVPLLKAGKDATVAANYRPVAITSYISRTVERVALRKVI